MNIKDYIIKAGTTGIRLSDALAEGLNLVAYAEPSKEPTEHLLKELLQSSEVIRNKKLGIVLITKGRNQTLNEVMAAFPDTVLIETDDISFAESLLDHFGLPSGSYPVLTLISKENNELKSLYRTSGYHVGSVDIMLGLI
ncbi:MAG TPA: hypothetical protein GX505_05325 [Clostridiales bacterium]|nr:hypothetical protein [Clostridiales bacterium]